MEETGSHSVLQARLAYLTARIAELKAKMSRTEGYEKITEFGEIGLLEQRHKRLEDQLRALDREGAGFRQNVKAEVENLADDLAVAVEEMVMRIDSGFTPVEGAKRPAKS
jgi:predicted  nucleic acid-binding Zn-ribbon protein